MGSFAELPIGSEVKQACQRMGFTSMTEIQEKAIVPLLEGKEIIAKAPTGTGKTAAFGIPLMEKLTGDETGVQSIILCPTRELCIQIVDELRDLAYFKPGIKIVALYGGQPIQRQINALKNKIQVVVATPGRMLDHIHRKTIRLRQVWYAVLDEADKMLDMGFYKDVCQILDRLPKEKQMAMFSATISREVMDIGWLYQRDTLELTVAPLEESRPQIAQYAIASTGRQRQADLTYLLRVTPHRRAMVFCNTKYATISLAGLLREKGLNADCLNGDMPQKDRNRIMSAFRDGKITILVATDVAARGIDVDEVDLVFNYEIPLENEYYTHRIGRTGRAKRIGTAYIFFGPEDEKRLRSILRYAQASVTEVEFDDQDNLVPVANKRL